MDKVKWGVIGAGGIADRRTIPGMLLAPSAELVAVMDVNEECVSNVKAKYGVKMACTSVNTLLSDPEVEAVYIATPVIFHEEQAIQAAKARKHILLEKPVALTCRAGERVIEAVKQQGILAAAGFMMRFHNCHQIMKEMTSKGNLGRIVSCRAQLNCWYPDIPGSWRQQRELAGGGSLMDLGIHCIDLIQFITGSKVRKVAAMTGTNTFTYAVEDSATLLFQTADDAFCTVEAFFNIPDAASKCRFEIYGTKGSILAEGTIGQIESGTIDMIIFEKDALYDAGQDRGDKDVIRITAASGNLYTKEIESFSRSILGLNPVDIPLEGALQVQRVIEAAYESALREKTILI